MLAACGGGERQDANEPEGDFRVEVVRASFPERQHVAEDVRLRLRVRNLDDRTLDNVAVTVETKATGANAPAAFGKRASGTGLADSERPVWLLEEGPPGGETAYAIPALPKEQRAPEEHLRRVFGDWVVEVAHSDNLVVVRTPPGSAHVVASALDRSGMAGVLGTVAGDDTILVVVTVECGGEVMARRLSDLAGL